MRADIFQSTLPARGATPVKPIGQLCISISIHAPRTGSDSCKFIKSESISYISIHAPRTGSDIRLFVSAHGRYLFQSTLPARGATPQSAVFRETIYIFQSTLPARGATIRLQFCPSHIDISIHAPRTGSDIIISISCAEKPHFNPRSPHGERLDCGRMGGKN